MKASLVIISSSGNSSSCSRSGFGSASDSTSTCGSSSSSSKILPWTGKYKLGAIAGVRVGKYSLGTRAGKCKVSVRFGKHKLGVRAGRYKLGSQARTSNYKLGASSGGQDQGRGPGPRPGAKQTAGGREIQRPSFIRVLKSKEKKLALTLFYCLDQER